jgi:hypothetical protein
MCRLRPTADLTSNIDHLFRAVFVRLESHRLQLHAETPQVTTYREAVVGLAECGPSFSAVGGRNQETENR